MGTEIGIARRRTVEDAAVRLNPGQHPAPVRRRRRVAGGTRSRHDVERAQLRIAVAIIVIVSLLIGAMILLFSIFTG